MEKDRLLAFTDGVIAIIITIMVLELKVPHGATFADLLPMMPDFLSYLLSFTYVAIYWNNHHHMLQTVEKVNGPILLANMNLLFWLSLIPFATAWAGTYNLAAAPTALYGFSLLMPAISYFILQRTIIRAQGPHSLLAKAIGKDLKGKASPPLYLAGMLLAFLQPVAAYALYTFVALMWIIPDRRIERLFKE